MIEMNEKRPDFGAITVVKKKNGNKEKKELYKPAEREALCTLACLISGRKVEIEDGKINLYFSHLFSRPFCTITDNPELVSLLEELVH